MTDGLHAVLLELQERRLRLSELAKPQAAAPAGMQSIILSISLNQQY
jgi:hypothetical protein